MKGPMILEFEGIAGCGKSTLCATLKETLSPDGIRVIWLTEKPTGSYFAGLGKTGSAPVRLLKTFSLPALCHALRFLFSSGRVRQYKLAALLYRIEAVYRHFLRTGGPSDLLVSDQSLVQTLVAVWGYDRETVLTEREKSAAARFLKTAPETKHFLCLLPLEEHVRRIRRRGKKRARLESIEDDTVLLEKLGYNEKTLAQIVDLKERVRGPEVRLDMLASPEALAAEVMKVI